MDVRQKIRRYRTSADPDPFPPPPEISQNVGFLSNSGPDSPKKISYHPSIQ